MSQIFVQETIYKSPNWGTQPKLLTVFLGLYEVEPFLARVRDSIAVQDWTNDVQLILVDNASTFSPFDEIFPLLSSLPCEVFWLRNRANYQALDLANDPSNRNINRETIRSKAPEEHVRDAALEFYRK